MTAKHSDDTLYETYIDCGRRVAETARTLGYPNHGTVGIRLKKIVAAREAPRPQTAPLPKAGRTIEEIIRDKKRQFTRKANYEEATKLINVTLPCEGPVAQVHIGDPHLDDDGCDISQLEADMKTILGTEGMYCSNVGDLTNNWVGRLAILYAEQHTTETEAWALVEWFLETLGPKLLYTVGGNHDCWRQGEQILSWIARQADSLYQSSEVRVQILDPKGKKLARVNCRHDFAGSSQYNPAHGPTKSLMFGVRDHIAVCGHKHKSGYNVFKDPDLGITCHALQVASYKMFDRYAKDKGFRDQFLGSSCTTVINTRVAETHADYIKPFWSVQEGAEYLKFLRRKK